jgi:hypothetical protein
MSIFGFAALQDPMPFWDPVPGVASGPLYAPDPWDTVTIGGEQLPGICSVKGEPTLAFDKKKAGGVDGATITINGYLPGPITIECLIWTAEQWRTLWQLAAKIWTKPNKKTAAKALAKPIRNPAFALWGITDVVILGVSVPEKGPIWGTRVVKIKCVEYVPQKAVAKTKTANGSADLGPINPHFNPARNQAGEPPSKTDIHPGGPAQTRKGGLG